MGLIITIEEHIKEQSDEIARKCVSYTPVLYKILKGRTDRAEPVASSILLRHDGNFFLVTASHVIYEAPINELGLHFDNTILPLEGDNFFTRMKNKDDDKLDFLIIKLTPEFVAALPSSFSFFDLRAMNVDYDDKEINSYLVLGYPSTRFKLLPKKKALHNTPFGFRTHIHRDKKIHEKLKTYPNTNLILYYRKKRINNTATGKNQEGPSPKGLSGCGVWVIANLIEGKNSPFFPIGILTEYDSNLCALTITRISVITEMIRKKWSIDIQPSKKVTIKMLSDNNFTFE